MLFKKSKYEPNIASSLVDLLFALLGASIILLAAFAAQAIYVSEHESRITVSIGQNYKPVVLGRTSSANSTSKPSLDFPISGCLTVSSSRSGIIYRSGYNKNWVRKMKTCSPKKISKPKTIIETKWNEKEINYFEKSFSIPFNLKKNELIRISIEPYDLNMLAAPDIRSETIESVILSSIDGTDLLIKEIKGDRGFSYSLSNIKLFEKMKIGYYEVERINVGYQIYGQSNPTNIFQEPNKIRHSYHEDGDIYIFHKTPSGNYLLETKESNSPSIAYLNSVKNNEHTAKLEKSSQIIKLFSQVTKIKRPSSGREENITAYNIPQDIFINYTNNSAKNTLSHFSVFNPCKEGWFTVSNNYVQYDRGASDLLEWVFKSNNKGQLTLIEKPLCAKLIS